MLELQRRSVCGLVAALVLGMCASGYAALTPIYRPFTPNVTTSYGNGPGDYQTRADAYGAGTNDLLNLNATQGGTGSGLGPQVIGLGELVTPQTGSTYGAPNNHSLTVNSITMPINSLASSALNVTLTITPGGLFTGSGNPIPPNSSTSVFNNTDQWIASGASIYTNTFTFSAGPDWKLMTLDLAGANLADSINNPAPPVLALDQTYLIGLEWPRASSANDNDVIAYRGPSVDPGGQTMAELSQHIGWQTWARALISAQAPRTYAMAINVPVPEPASFLIMSGSIAVCMLWRIRRGG